MRFVRFGVVFFPLPPISPAIPVAHYVLWGHEGHTSGWGSSEVWV